MVDNSLPERLRVFNMFLKWYPLEEERTKEPKLVMSLIYGASSLSDESPCCAYISILP